jgi:MFS family permease
MVSLVLAAIGLGVVFGTVDVGVVAFTAEQQTASFAGIVLATFAGTSMVGGILYGSRAWPGPLHWHPRIAALALLVVTLAIPFATNNGYLVVVIALAGFSVAPALIGIFTLASRLVPRRHLTEGLTWTNSGLAAGFALGSSAAGIIVDAVGTRAGLALTVLGAALAATAVAFIFLGPNRGVRRGGGPPPKETSP